MFTLQLVWQISGTVEWVLNFKVIHTSIYKINKYSKINVKVEGNIQVFQKTIVLFFCNWQETSPTTFPTPQLYSTLNRKVLEYLSSDVELNWQISLEIFPQKKNRKILASNNPATSDTPTPKWEAANCIGPLNLHSLELG